MQTRAALLGVATAGAIALFGVAGAAMPANAPAPQSAPTVTAPAPQPAAPAVPPTPASAGAGAGASPTPTTVGPDVSALSGMIHALTTTSHNVMIRASGSNIAGSADPANRAAQAVARGKDLEIAEVVNQGSVFVKANLGSDLNKQVGIPAGTWMKLDPALIKPDNQLLVQPDGSALVDMTGIMTGITSLVRIDANHLRGTLDLARVTGHTLPDPDEVARAGAAAMKAPFTVTADAQGRITNFRVDTRSFDPTLSLDVTFSAYGAGTPVVSPATTVPAPKNVYTLFNN